MREYGLTSVVKLASNENPLGCSRAVREALAALPDPARYPDGSGHDLVRALARRHDVEPARITLGNGSNDVLDLIARCFLEPGTNAVMDAHGFVVYRISTLAAGARPRAVPSTDRFGHDPDGLAGAVDDDTRVLFVANPNNPTGTGLDEARLRALVDRVPERVLVVVDEAYHDYAVRDGLPDVLAWVAERPNVVVTRTFAKAYGLAGLRIGYGISHPRIADWLNRVRHPFNTSTAAQRAALAALEDPAFVAEGVRLNAAERPRVAAALSDLGLDVLPSFGNFLTFDCAGPAGLVNEGLLRRGVIVRPLGGYGMPRHLRVSVGLPEENERFLAALPEALAEVAEAS